MIYQWLAVGLIVTIAAAYVARKIIGTWFGSKKTGCGGGCGSGCASTAAPKSGTSAFVPVEQLTVRTSRK